MYANIPQELQERRQWVCSREDRAPLNARTGGAARVTDPTTWSTFEEAIKAKLPHIGFVLCDDDPYTIIDLDDKVEKPATPAQLERHKKIISAFDTYIEMSTSGRGYHIIAKGSVPQGRKRDTVEIYSNARYMICTGQAVKNKPIVECQAMIDTLFGEMEVTETVDLIDAPSLISDNELVDMAMRAANSTKFNALCQGDMTGYPSQSEADFALLSILAFYTRDNEQVTRIFRMSALGKRAKAQRDEYIKTALRKIRAEQPAQVDAAELMSNAAKVFRTDKESKSAAEPDPVGCVFPSGLVGDLAEHFYKTAVRPVKEVALAAALSVTAGVCGRSYNISGAGLNQYIILLGRTGIGKEGAMSGIDKLMSSVRTALPMIDQFVGPATFASGQALLKVLVDRPCFVSVLGEFGLTLQQLSDKRANGAQIMLRKVLLDVYTKSGWTSVLRPMVYSDSDRNTTAVQAPCVTILGESTPETFFEGLELSHISEGLIPRFSIIEYTGGRPERNKKAGGAPSASIIKRFSDLTAHSLTTTNSGNVNSVQMTDGAEGMLDAFDTRVDAVINATVSEVDAQLWNRAHLKALRLAALIAVGRDHLIPCVNEDDAAWAIKFVEADIKAVGKRFQSGDVGAGESKQLSDLQRAVTAFFSTKSAAVDKREQWVKMRQAGCVPFAYIQPKLVSLASFRNDRMGSSAAIKRTLTTALELSLLTEVAKQQVSEKFGYHGACYGIGSDWA